MPSETDARWKRDFPVPSEEDSYVTRREFTKFLGLTSLAFLAGTFAAAARKLLRRGTRDRGAGEVVASVEEVGLGGYKLFRYPTENDPCILLRLSHDRFVAFNQNCTHLSCPVHLKPDTMQLVCPCHKGFFNADDGRPVAGPPKRPLPALPISIRDGQVWVAPSEVETA